MRASVEAAGMSLDDMAAKTKIDFSEDMHAGSKAWKTVWSAGQGVGVVSHQETVADVVADIARAYASAT
jgi:nitronate monooxygenase